MNGYMSGMLLTTMEPRLFDLDFQLLTDSALTLISVLVLFFAMSYLLFNPVRAMLEKRQNKIADELSTAAEAEETAKKLQAEYEQKLADINKEADEILRDARSRALANESQIVAQAKEEARRIVDRAHVEAELEKAKAADEVKQEMILVASAIAGKVVAANINTEIQNSLVDETLKEMGENTWLS
ncbi:MAG: F0F1 ATP synthase subunit B [Lachnospiraceae bacterium]|nr:F0F1 ATP synthase subunit B [Lachnospiraceae bacterium]